MARPTRYPDELVQRGVRLALERGRPIAHVAADLAMHPETMRKRVRQAQAEETRVTIPDRQAAQDARHRRSVLRSAVADRSGADPPSSWASSPPSRSPALHLIYCWDHDGRSDPRGFARADHCDDIHWGMDA